MTFNCSMLKKQESLKKLDETNLWLAGRGSLVEKLKMLQNRIQANVPGFKFEYNDESALELILQRMKDNNHTLDYVLSHGDEYIEHVSKQLEDIITSRYTYGDSVLFKDFSVQASKELASWVKKILAALAKKGVKVAQPKLSTSSPTFRVRRGYMASASTVSASFSDNFVYYEWNGDHPYMMEGPEQRNQAVAKLPLKVYNSKNAQVDYNILMVHDFGSFMADYAKPELSEMYNVNPNGYLAHEASPYGRKLKETPLDNIISEIVAIATA